MVVSVALTTNRQILFLTYLCPSRRPHQNESSVTTWIFVFYSSVGLYASQLHARGCLAPGKCSANCVEQMSYCMCHGVLEGSLYLKSEKLAPALVCDIGHDVLISPPTNLSFLTCQRVREKPRPGIRRVGGVKLCTVLPATGAPVPGTGQKAAPGHLPSQLL